MTQSLGWKCWRRWQHRLVLKVRKAFKGCKEVLDCQVGEISLIRYIKTAYGSCATVVHKESPAPAVQPEEST
ncbi:hypothetical protein M7I_4910 [Glarea lozoyensis 74030]|uniref:Uncharacterized protein n=1 Tax=Glarea lozoyensis (strain ATCC 74030 / MF5533) TaxID=1104152 RepID=H0EQG1_GLAL7|nr:hypothetical protein M7I_4910 [Glarea lozoyensis 74030]